MKSIATDGDCGGPICFKAATLMFKAATGNAMVENLSSAGRVGTCSDSLHQGCQIARVPNPTRVQFHNSPGRHVEPFTWALLSVNLSTGTIVGIRWNLMVARRHVLHYSSTKHPKREARLFVESDFWNLFGMDSGPAPVWAVLVPLLVLVLPAVVILGCLVVDLIRPGPGSP